MSARSLASWVFWSSVTRSAACLSPPMAPTAWIAALRTPASASAKARHDDRHGPVNPPLSRHLDQGLTSLARRLRQTSQKVGIHILAAAGGPG